MGILRQETSFDRYDLTEEEERQALMMSQLTIMYLKDLRGRVAESKLRLEVRPDQFQVFLQQEAAFQGQLQTLDAILNAVKEAYEEQLVINSNQQSGEPQ
jgi:hypothetical protein